MILRHVPSPGLLLLLSFALIHLASGRFCYTDCFRTKGCDFKPYGCTPYVNCTYAYSYQSDGTWAYFELLGQAAGTADHYVALGFGSSPAMGNNTVLECSSFNGGPLLGRVSYNMGKSNMRVQMTQSQQTDLVRTLAIDYYNGMIYCHIARRIDVPPGVNGNTVFPLGPPTYPIMAAGQTTTDSTGQGVLQVHSLDPASPAYPFVSSQTISVYQFSVPAGSIIPVTQGGSGSGGQQSPGPQYSPPPMVASSPSPPMGAPGPSGQQPIVPVMINGVPNSYNNEGPPMYTATQPSSSDEPPQNVTVYVNPLIVYTQPGGPGSGEIIYATQSSVPGQSGFVAAGAGPAGGGPVIIAGGPPGQPGSATGPGGYTGMAGTAPGQAATVNGQPIYGPGEVYPNESGNRPSYEGFGPGQGQGNQQGGPQGFGAGGSTPQPGYSPVTQMPQGNENLGGPSSQGYNPNDPGQTPVPINQGGQAQATTPFPQGVNQQGQGGQPIGSSPYPQGGPTTMAPSYQGPTDAPFIAGQGQGNMGPGSTPPMQSSQNFQGTPQPGNNPLNDQAPYGPSTGGYPNQNQPTTQGYGQPTGQPGQGGEVYPAGVIPVGAGMGDGGSTMGYTGPTTPGPNQGYSGQPTMNPQDQQGYPGSTVGPQGASQGSSPGYGGPGTTANPQFEPQQSTQNAGGLYAGPIVGPTSTPAPQNQGFQDSSTPNYGQTQPGQGFQGSTTPGYGPTQQGQGFQGSSTPAYDQSQQGQGYPGSSTPGYGGFETTTDVNGHSYPAASTGYGGPGTPQYNDQQNTSPSGVGGAAGFYPGSTDGGYSGPTTSPNTPFPGYGQTGQSTYPTTPINEPFYGSTNNQPQGMAQQGGSTPGYGAGAGNQGNQGQGNQGTTIGVGAGLNQGQGNQGAGAGVGPGGNQGDQQAVGPGGIPVQNQNPNGAYNIPYRDEFGVHGVIPGSNNSIEPQLLKVHAILMTLSWMIFFSTAILFARFYRGFWPNSTLCGLFLWFHFHRTLNIIGIGASIAGFVCIFVARDWQWVGPRPDMNSKHNTSWPAAHAMCGLLACVIVWFQPINAVMRCHPKGMCRPLYNIFHAVFGYGGFILGIAAIMIACTHFDFMFIRQKAAFGLCIAFMGATALVFAFLELLSICQWFKQRRNTGDIEIVQPDGRTHVTLSSATKKMNICRIFVFILYLVPAIGCAVAISAIIGTRKNHELHQDEMNYLLSTASNS
uniref:ascorbate ferrireductase (transmembrane) n=1 Tax=Panagrellus redivivus TaxID=6233 RepID=A0A7E4VKB3_PANRE